MLHTSFGDLLQRNDIPSPVVGQVRVGCCVLFLHIESSEEARLTPGLVYTTHCSLRVWQWLPCLLEKDGLRKLVGERERECMCVCWHPLPSSVSHSLHCSSWLLRADVIIHAVRKRKDTHSRPVSPACLVTKGDQPALPVWERPLCWAIGVWV